MNKLKFWWAALFLGVSTGATAQEPLEDSQTAISGTEEADDIDVAPTADATANISTVEGGKLAATATGVDAKEGDDTVDGSIAVTTNAIASANLVIATETTEAKATAVGVNAGGGDDEIGGALAFTSTASASGLYAGDMSYQPPAAPSQEKKVEVSIKSEASATGVDSGEGEDIVRNDALFAVTALATSGGSASQFSATVQESASFKAESEATATATGISTGDGSDEVTNDGLMTNIATATSGALAVALVAPKDENAPAGSEKTAIKSDATSKATATATGINSANDSTEDSSEETSPWGVDGLKVTYHKTVATEGSDDVVENNVALVNAAIATSGAGAGGVSNKVDGSMQATANAESTAQSSGVTSGVGSDRIINHGALTSNATANAGALSVSIEVGEPSEAAPTPQPGDPPAPAKPSEDKKNKSSTTTNVTATATASGINADGSGSEEITDGFAEISNGSLVIDYHQTTNTVAGNDVVENHGVLLVTADADAGSLSAGVTQSSGGSSSSEAKSTANGTADGITTGGGNDRVTNDGLLTVTATSEASALSVAMAVGMPAEETPGQEPAADTESDKVSTETNTSVQAESQATGIRTSGESNSETTRHAELNSSSLTVTFGESSTAAVDDDVVENNAVMTTTASATASAADGGIALDAVGSVSSDASSSARATSTGVATGAGNDTVSNDFLFTASSTASADSLSVGLTASKPTTGSGSEPDKTNVSVKAGATAEASTSGIDAEGTGHDTSKHTAITLTANGLEVVRTSSDASQAGTDRVTNHGAMLVDADASAGATSAGLSIGVTGSVTADATSKADASSRAIHTGGGADVIENSGLLTNDATASALSVALSVNVSQPAGSTSEEPGGEPPAAEQLAGAFSTMTGGANAEATARATGIDAEGSTHSRSTSDSYTLGPQGLAVELIATSGSMAGDDRVTNSGGLTSTSSATAGAGSINAAFDSEGTAATEAKATVKASADGVLTGGGSDEVTNSGVLLTTATASSSAISGSLVVGAKPQTPPPSSTPPTPSKDKESKASSDTSVSADARATGIDTEGTGHSETSETNISLSFAGLSITKETSSNAAAGDDTVVNQGAIIASGSATSETLSASIAITSGGSTKAESNSTATSYGTGVTTGAGSDHITNSGALTSSATSNASAITLALTVGQPQETTPAPPSTPPASPPSKLTTSSESNVTAGADSFGIDAEARVTQSTTNRALTIDANGLRFELHDTAGAAAGNDTVINNAVVTSTASATADSTSAAVVLDAAGSVNSEAQTTARASSHGIHTGAGNDHIENNFLLTTRATATADSIALALTVAKPPEKSANTPTTPGSAPDKTNVKVDARATATAAASGIDAEGRQHDSTRDIVLQIGGNVQQLTVSGSESSQAGADVVSNHGVLDVGAIATSGTVSAGIAVNAAGSVDIDSTSKAEAASAGILTGGGADNVTNTFLVQSSAEASATALAAAVSVSQPSDGTGTKPSTLDGLRDKFATSHSVANAEASAQSVGIDTEGGAVSQLDSFTVRNSGEGRSATGTSTRTTLGGDDVVDNEGAVLVSADAETLAGAAEVRVQTEGTASSEANATSTATSGAVLTGAGSDEVNNQGALTATSTSSSGALALSFSMSSAQGSKARSDARATSESTAVGIGTGANETNREREATLTLLTDGVELTYSDELLALDGADTVDNDGAVLSSATATAGVIGVAVAIDGAASTDVTATATARADGIDAGGGDDVLTNDGALGALATSSSGALALTFGQAGDEKSRGTDKVEATSTANADAFGIRADSGTNSLVEGSLLITTAGMDFSLDIEEEAATGNDIVVNRGGIGANANATAGALGGAVAIDGAAKADVDAIANSRAAAIDAGGGDDNVLNEGGVLSSSTASAGVIAVSVGVKTSGQSQARAKVEASSSATASSSGIATDGSARNESTSASLVIDASGMSAEYSSSSAAVSGNDVLDNRNTVSSAAVANSGAISAAVSVRGAASANANSTAAADSAALDTGGGADSVTNTGTLASTAIATAVTVNAAISTEGNAVSNAGLMGAGTTAEARATGITTAGMEEMSTVDATSDIDFDDVGAHARVEFVTDGLAADGSDTVDNSGAITASSTATAPRLDVAVSGRGVAVSMGRASSESRVSGIETGHQDDVVDNTGAIQATTTSTATLVNIAVSSKGVAGAANSVWDGGTEAKAVAAGIDADSGERVSKLIEADAESDLARVRYTKEETFASGDDILRNAASVWSQATATAPTLSIAGTGNGVSAAVSTSTAEADSVSLRGGDGDDEIRNSGHLTSITNANAATANVAVANNGAAIAADAVWDGGTKATANSRGIAGDGGHRERSRVISVGTDGISDDEESVLADGVDVIVNSGQVDSTANAFALSASIAAVGSGVSAATATSTATANATAIDAGAGASIDDVENSGELNVIANADAYAAAISVTNNGVAGAVGAVWDGGTKASARARGIDVGSGGEVVTNSGAIDAEATADTLEVAVAVTMNGVAAAVATSTSTANATAVDASEGNDSDEVNNSGNLTVDAYASAVTAALSFTNNGASISADAVWDGGTKANARARGIDTGAAADEVSNSGDILVTSDGETIAVSAAATVNGGAGAIATSTVDSNAAGIDAGDEDVRDVVSNTGNVTANANSTAITATLSFAMTGVAVSSDAPWDGGTGAKSVSRGINVGLGSDQIDNSGDVNADANATSVSGSVAVSVTGAAGGLARATADANAIALDAGEGTGDDVVNNSGALIADSDATSAAVAASFTGTGVAVSYVGGSHANAVASGVSTGAGVDIIDNAGAITSSGDATAVGVSVSVTATGVTAAATKSESDADAFGIDAGDGNDSIENRAALDVDAISHATAVNVALVAGGAAIAADSAWDGGTTAKASASGLAGGAGDDTIATRTSAGVVDTYAHAQTESVSVSVTGVGFAASVSTSTSEADATAIDGGAGRDIIVNDSVVTGSAEADATSVSVSVAFEGVALAADAFWDGGTKAKTDAKALSGGDGNDDLFNEGTANAIAHSETLSAQVAATFGATIGLSAAAAASTSTANAYTLSGGAGDDQLVNNGTILSRSDAFADGLSVSFTPQGVTMAGAFDAGTKGHSSATGMSGDGGTDTLVNAEGSVITLDASSQVRDLAASMTFAGVAAVNSNAEVNTLGFGLDGGAGDDTVVNAGTIGGVIDADSTSAAVSLVGAGGAVVFANSTANAGGSGQAGGLGNDVVGNTGTIDLEFNTHAMGLSAGLAVAGGVWSQANADSIIDAHGLHGDAGEDEVINLGGVTIDANATVTALSVSIAGVGGSGASANSVANSSSTGLSGGADADTLLNDTTGVVDVHAGATLTSNSVSVTLTGAAFADARTSAEVYGTGLAGGDGSDDIRNLGEVIVTAASSGTTTGFSLNATGAAFANTGVESNARAVGIDAGSGDDFVRNFGSIDVGPVAADQWMSFLRAESTGVSITGFADAQASTLARTRSTGIDGGAGTDELWNTGSLSVRANALTEATADSINVFGSANGGGESGAFTRAIGLDGADGDDLLASTDTLTVSAVSRLYRDGTSFSFAGGSSAESELVAETEALGLGGGDGADDILTVGTISITAGSTLQSEGGGTTIFGASGNAGKSGAVTIASGIDGGAGDDIIDSQADITIESSSHLNLNSSSYTFGGSATSSGTLAAITESHGLTGGAGADSIGNGGTILINAGSELDSVGDSETTFGGTGSFAVSGGISRAVGISGGDDNDVIENRAGGELDINANVDIYTESVGYVFAGSGPTAGAVLTGNADVTGMSGDTGNDTLFNRGSIVVSSNAELFAKGGAQAELTGTSQPESTGSADVTVFAQGLSGGSGDDFMGSLGTIEVTATGVAAAFNDANTGTFSVANDNEAGTLTHSRATATGFDGGEGANRTEISNDLTVLADSTSHGLASSSGATLTFSSGANSRSTSHADAQATGIAGLGGDDSVFINADVAVTATSSTAKAVNLEFTVDADIRPVPEDGELLPPDVIDGDDPLPPVADYQEHEVVFWESDHCVGEDPPGCQEPDNLPGVVGGHYQLQMVADDPDGDGPEPPVSELRWVFLQDGLVQPHVITINLGSFASYAAANGSGLSGQGDAQGTANATATAHGLHLAGGNNTVDQDGALTVQATAQGVMHTSADGDGIEGDSTSNASAYATATAVGMEFGDGNDVVRIGGDVSVTAIPIAQARAHASADDICIWFFGWWCGDLGDSYSDATAESHGTAAGIRAGGGNNSITIDGALTVTSRPDIRNQDSTGEYSGSAIGEDRQNVTVTSTSVARGIDTGGGNDAIINNGTVVVEAWDLRSACDGASCGGIPASLDSVTASGIVTGAGNDIVRNLGSIRVETIVNDARSSSLAIDTGDGDDQLFLGDGSSIVGSVSLGIGNDTLDLRGTPTITNTAGTLLNVNAGDGIDTLVLNGLGSYGGSPVSIERAIKRETGTYTLASLPSLQYIRIEDGALRVNCCYTFSPTGTFETFFNVNGDSGVLSLSGNATLGGTIRVERRGDTFIANGTRYNVIHADGAVSGDFSEIELPTARPLLHFELQREAQDVDVVAVAPSFSSVTENPLYTQIAVSLDGIAPGSSGDLSELFGGLQNLGGDFDRALASFSPDTHLATSGSVLTNLREMTRVLQGHLGDSRVRYRHAPHARMPEASMSFSGGSGGLGMMQLTPDRRMSGMADLPAPPPAQAKASKAPRSQAWMLGIDAQGDYRSIEGYSAFDTDTQGFMFGADRKGDNWLVGVTLGQAKTDIASGELTTGEINTWLASAYATWFDDNLYFETGLTIGKQDFEDRRLLNVASDLRTASSKHDGKAWSAFMAGGLSMDYGGFAVEPYLSLNYFEASEDGFEETGADSISQVIGKRDGNAFLGEAGANFSFRHDWGRGLVDWHASLAVSHDFGVDSDPLTYSYVGVPDALFSIDGRPVDDSATLWGLGVSFMGDQSALALDYRGLQDSYHEEKFFSARMSLRF